MLTMQFCVSLVQRARRKKITFLHPELTKLKKPTRVRVIDINLTISTPTANFALVQLAIALDKPT